MTTEIIEGTAPRGVAARLRRIPVTTVLLGASGVVFVLLLWQLAIATDFISERSVPRPTKVLSAAGTLLGDDRFQPELVETLRTWVTSMVLVAVIAVPIGLLVGYFAFLSESVSSAVHVFRSIPSTALIPVAIIMFGLGQPMKVAIVTYAISWPMLLNTMYGVRNVDPTTVTVGRSFGWSQAKIVRRVILPSATPFIATGIRIAGGIALIVTLSSELLGASVGVGTEMIRYQAAELPEFVYAAIMIVGVLGIILNYGLSAFEQRLLRWLPSRDR